MASDLREINGIVEIMMLDGAKIFVLIGTMKTNLICSELGFLIASLLITFVMGAAIIYYGLGHENNYQKCVKMGGSYYDYDKSICYKYVEVPMK